ncbi:hypothetical protein F4604DRAFT_143912 [Suillus subluteus]|nr:hypothetical protein F4604DRAFT_143912 [Suillus subluteus]
MRSAPAHHRHPFGHQVEVISDGEDLGLPVPDSSLTTQSCTAAVSDEVDGIEDFSSKAGNNRPSLPLKPQLQRVVRPTPPIRSCIIRDTRKMFEPQVPFLDLWKRDVIVRDTRRVFELQVPFLDLRKHDALSGGTGAVKKTKSRKTTKPVPRRFQSHFDHITTSSTQFTSKELPRTKDPPLKLPLRAWAIGLNIFSAEDGSEPPVFEYDPKNRRLTVAVHGQFQFFQFQQTNGFENVTVTADNKSLKDNVVIQLLTVKDCKICDNGK